MHKHDKTRIAPGDVATALALLTRLPVRAGFTRSAEAAWAYPLVGIATAVLAAVPVWILLSIGVPPELVAIVWVAMHVILTGAMHEDGLADSADGLWGGWDRTRRLEIMKDSRIGSYGVIALVLSLGARWAAAALILNEPGWLWSLMAVDVASRAVMPPLMTILPHARDSGLSHAQGRPSRETAGIAVILAIIALVLCTGQSALGLIVTAGLCGAACGAIAKTKIGGQTGDTLGASQQIAEIGLLFAILA